MILESLLLSCDLALIRVVRPVLEKLAMQVEICQEAKKAADIIVSEKFDAIIVDCDDLKGGWEVLEGLRSTPSNKNSAVFAVLNGKRTTSQEAFAMGANFVMQKPISSLNASRCFNAALSFMVRERRRYFRQPVKMVVRVVVGETEFKATSTNVSEGGLALLLHQAVPKNATPRLSFVLPGTDTRLDLESEVAWIDIKGCAGFRFRNVPQRSQEALEKWLDAQGEHEPVSVGQRKSPAEQPPPHP
jgi:CheY-like chemotaxis protein